jgi:hypothetical protein
MIPYYPNRELRTAVSMLAYSPYTLITRDSLEQDFNIQADANRQYLVITGQLRIMDIQLDQWNVVLRQSDLVTLIRYIKKNFAEDAELAFSRCEWLGVVGKTVDTSKVRKLYMVNSQFIDADKQHFITLNAEDAAAEDWMLLPIPDAILNLGSGNTDFVQFR